MANNKTTYVLQFDAELGTLEKKLSSIKGLMSNVLGSTQAPKGLDKSFERIEELIDRIKQKASQPIDSKSGFTSISKDINTANSALAGMLKIFKSIESMSESAKISFLPPEAQAELNAIVKSLTDYAKAIDNATTETAELTKARNDLAKAEENVNNAQQKVEQKKALLEEAKLQKATAKQAIEDIKARKEQLAELRKEQEKIERFYNTSDESGNKPNRSKKYDGASMRPQDIKRKISELEKVTAEDGNSLAEHSEQLKKASNNINSYTNQLSTAERVLKDSELAHEKLTEKVSQLEQAFKEGSAEQQQKAFAQLRKEAEALGVGLDGINEGFSDADAEELLRRFTELKTRGLDPLSASTDRASAEVLEMGDALDSTKRKTQEAAAAQESMNDAIRQQEALEGKIKQFLGLAGAAQLLRHALRDAISTITELDATMTEMAVVTDLSIGDYWDQLPEYSQRASELGVSINSAYEAATLYYQQGLKTNEVNAISTETLKMAKIAGLDAADATNKMTAALRGFNMELNEESAKRVADVYSQLAAITAADVDEISSAMTKTASIASSAGMEFETTAAFLSQIVETTRESAETAGTAMKTVIARFQELKKAPEEIGEVDGEIVDANAIETALRSVGVSLRGANGQFRELDDVFLELSSKWDGLDKNTQRYIATIAAGSRQQSRFIAMMSDYGRTQELVTAANNSAGASQRQFEKTTESLEYKITELKNAWHEFTMGILDSDLVKFGVDILNKFLEIVNRVTSSFDGLLGSITKIGSVIAIFKLGQAVFEKIRPMISQFLLSLVEDFREKGEMAGRGYAQGVRKGVSTPGGATQSTQPNKPKGTVGRVEGDGIKGKASNAGLAVMDAVGVGHFVDASQAHANVVQARSVLGTTKEARAANKAKYDMQKQELKAYQDSYTVHKNGTVSQKGRKGVLPTKEAEEAKEKMKQLTEATEEYEQAGESLEANSKQQWESISSGLQAASMAAAGVGMAFGAIGQAFTDAGFEEAGKIISGVGSAFMILSTVMTIVSSILPLLSTGFGAAGAAGVGSGVASTAAWGVFGLIVLAVMAGILITIAIILLVMKAIQNASPEKKLEDAQKAADQAAEAAETAAEAYDKLAESMEQLDGKYKALEDLTRGTEEWNDAVRDINNSVLELIDEYLELAKFVENKEGVLTLDVESDEVQGVLQDAKAREVVAKNDSILANAAVTQAENDVKFGNMEAIKKVGKQRGWQAFGTSVGVGAGAGAAIGGTAGAVQGAFLGPLGSVVGGVLGGVGLGLAGALTGALAGAVIGPITAAGAKTDEDLQDAVEDLAESVSSGAVDADYDSMYEYLTGSLGVAADEARVLAEEFSSDIDSLIEYGDSVNAAKAQQKAAYDAIAASAQSLANTMTMSAQQIQQSSVLVDGDLVEGYYEAEMKKLEGKDLKNLKDNEDVKAAIKEKYGDNATVDKKGNVTYNKDGERVTVKLSEEEIKSMVATKKATAAATTAIEYSDDAIARVAKTVGAQLGNDNAGAAAVNALYMSNKGGSLTQTDLGNLQSGKINFDEIWKSMSENEKKAYGDDIQNLKDDFSEAIREATDKFKKAGDAVRGFMTADLAKGFSTKLEEIADYVGGESAIKQVQQATDALMGLTGSTIDANGNRVDTYNDRFTTEQRQALQSRINMTDWSNIEQLLSLQIDLEQQYGFTAEEAKAYTDELGAAAYATSSLTTTIKAFGELWKATETINQSLIRLTELQWEYEKALRGTGDSVQEAIDGILEEYKLQAEQRALAYEESNNDIAKIYAQGGLNYGTDLRKFVSLGADGVSVDDNELQKAIDAGQVSEEDATEWIENLTNQYATSQEQIEGLREIVQSIEELEQENEETFYELRDMAKEAILESLQKQIDLQQETLDATREANALLISKIQEQIDDERQARANEEAEENIANLQSQQAYLAMDTSGANDLQVLNLDKQIEEAEQSYQDSLIDQTIQSLQDANAKAEEQRERQISLAQMSLEEYQKSNEFQMHVDEQLSEMLAGGTDWENSSLGELLKEKFTEGMSSKEAESWATMIGGQVGAAEAWKTTKWGEATSNTEAYLAAIAEAQGAKVENLVGEAAAMKISKQASQLNSAGFDISQAGVEATRDENGKISGYKISDSADSATSERQMNNLYEAYSKDQGWQESETYKKLMSFDEADRGDIQDIKTYYKENTKGIMEGTTGSYSDYLFAKTQEVSKKEISAIEDIGAQMIPASVANWESGHGTGKHYQLGIPGYQGSGRVKIGEIATDAIKSKIETALTDTSSNGNKHLAYVQDQGLYGRRDTGSTKWYKVTDADNNKGHTQNLVNSAASYLRANQFPRRKYETGGLADFTGPAWLDGTKSRPEYVLNAAQTERFFSLIDVLENYDSDKNGGHSSGDNYFDIEINVEKLENDYDVEKVAEKIRSMIYNDATYRNVNAINHIR